MQYGVKVVEGEFQAREAAAMTGVSPTLQRDWRRRGLLDEWEGEGRKRYTTSEIALLTVMGILSDAKISVKGARIYARELAFSVALFLDRTEGAYAVEGADLPTREIPNLIEQAARDVPARYAFVPLPEPQEDDPLAGLYSLGSPADLEAKVSQKGRWAAGLMLDLKIIAEEIAAKAPRPLIRYILSEATE